MFSKYLLSIMINPALIFNYGRMTNVAWSILIGDSLYFKEARQNNSIVRDSQLMSDDTHLSRGMQKAASN